MRTNEAVVSASAAASKAMIQLHRLKGEKS
jgi:hypothetical protein